MRLPFDAANSVRLKISRNSFAARVALFALLYVICKSFNAFILLAASFASIHDEHSSMPVSDPYLYVFAEPGSAFLFRAIQSECETDYGFFYARNHVDLSDLAVR